jgi:hypothetical protein
MAAAVEWLGKQVCAAVNTHAAEEQSVLRCYKQDFVGAGVHNWKEATIQSGLEPWNREIAIVRSHYQATTSVDTAG